MTKKQKKAPKTSFKEHMSQDADMVFKNYKAPTLMRRLRGYFMGGILVTAPVGITFYISWMFIKYVDLKVATLLPEAYRPENYLAFSIPGLGLLVVILVLIMIGWLTAGLIGRLLVRFTHNVMARVPVARSIYMVLKQFLETVASSQTSAFKEVVLVEYPRPNIWALGFVAGTTEGEVQNVTGEKVINVFLPTTPNPTSGFLLFVPERDLYKLGMSVEEGIKMVISGGIVTPPDRRPKKEQQESLIERTSVAYVSTSVAKAKSKAKPKAKAISNPKAPAKPKPKAAKSTKTKSK